LTTKELEIKQFVDVIALAENVINLDFRQWINKSFWL
jgi:hypothetical protein